MALCVPLKVCCWSTAEFESAISRDLSRPYTCKTLPTIIKLNETGQLERAKYIIMIV